MILEIQSQIESNRAGYRKLPGTELKNDQTGEVVYTPPQTETEIIALMKNLETFINDDSISDLKTNLITIDCNKKFGRRIKAVDVFDPNSGEVRNLIPLSLLIIFFLLFIFYESYPLALLIIFTVPLSTIGSFYALALRDYQLRVSAGIGFTTLFGIASMHGSFWRKPKGIFKLQNILSNNTLQFQG